MIFINSLNLFFKTSMAVRKVLMSSFSYSSISFALSESRVVWRLELTLASKVPYTKWSRGLKPGEDGGQSCDEMKLGRFFLHQFWVVFAFWAGAKSCWKVYLFSFSISWDCDLTTFSMICLLLYAAFILAPGSTKTKGKLPFLDISVQPILFLSAWNPSTVLISSVISSAHAVYMRTFWLLGYCSTLKNFSSAKTIWSICYLRTTWARLLIFWAFFLLEVQ